MQKDVSIRLAGMVEKMPAFPGSVQRILELTTRLDTAPGELVRVIEHDPVMTVKILKLVNSAWYRLPRRISSINHAVAYMGINTVRNMALSIATIGMLPRTNHAGFDMSDFLRHSLATATIARRLGELVVRREGDVSDFFVAGLLHDIGKVVFAMFMAVEFSRALALVRSEGVSLCQAETRMIGVDHGMVGAMLGERWRLHTGLVTCIRDHHNASRPGSALRDCVFAANQISKKVGLSAGDTEPEDFPKPVHTRFDMGVADLYAAMENMDAEIERAMVFAGL